MAIIVNGVNIPTNGDFIKVGNTNIDRVICNGVTVWERMRDADILAALCAGTLAYTKYQGPDHLSGKDSDGDDVDVDITHTGNIHAKYDLYAGVESDYIIFSNEISGVDHVDSDSASNGPNYIEFTYDLTSFNKLDFSGTKTADTSIGGNVWGKFHINIDGTRKSNEYMASSRNDEESGDFAYTPFSESIDVSSYTGVHTIKLVHEYWMHTQMTNCSTRFQITQLKLLS